MPHDVDLFILLTGKGHVAYFADERLVSGVLPVMCAQRFLLLERHVANVAHEGVLFEVAVQVVLLLNLEVLKLQNSFQTSF